MDGDKLRRQGEPDELVVAEAERIVAGEAAKTLWSSEHSDPLEDIQNYVKRVRGKWGDHGSYG